MTRRKRRPTDHDEDAVDAVIEIETFSHSSGEQPAIYAFDRVFVLKGDKEAVREAIERQMKDVSGQTFVVVPVDRAVSSAQPTASRAGRLPTVKVAADAPAVYEVLPKLANAIHALGNNTVADLLGVSRSQPGRWARREEGISASNQAAILDLDFVLSLLLRTMPARLAGMWLVSPNAHLGGARPVDAFRLDGHRRVVQAIQAYAEGAFA